MHSEPFTNKNMQSIVEKYVEYLDKVESNIHLSKNLDFDPSQHTNVLNSKLFTSGQVSGLGVYVEQHQFAGVVVDQIKLQIS